MTEQQKHSCCSKKSDQEKTQSQQVTEVMDLDPVCGMKVDEDSPYFIHWDQKKYLFCSLGSFEIYRELIKLAHN